jgi:kumamolisin
LASLTGWCGPQNLVILEILQMAKKTYVVLRGSRRAKDSFANVIDGADPNERIDVTIGLAGPALPSADEFVGKTLTPAEFAKQFGASKGDADKVAKELKKFGLKVESVSLATRSMKVSGTVEAMSKAFKARLSIMRSSRQNDYRGRSGSLSVPAELQGIITGVFGLDERRMARRRARTPAASDAASGALGPADLEARYNFPPGDGSGQSIAVAEFGGGFFQSDLVAYCNKFNRPVTNINAVSVNAPAFTLNQILQLPPDQRDEELGASGEVMMDVEIIAGLCPGANITVLFATFDQQGWVELLNTVMQDPPVSLSVSWGNSEDNADWSVDARTAVDERLNALRLLGVTTCVSSGDDGAGDLVSDGEAHVDFPASSPNVLSVGGTMLNSVDEVVWNEPPGQRFIGQQRTGGGSSGGGVSAIFPRPAWQNVSVTSLNSGSIDGRIVPDIAALAGPPLYDLIFAGQPGPNGGTSASAPVWASLVARVNAALPSAKQQRFLTPLLYTNSSNGDSIGSAASRDVVSGNNKSSPDPGRGYRAKAGFDAVTGWGVPNGVKLLNELKNI